MRVNMKVRRNEELESLADEVAREVWAALCSVPELHALYPGYFVSVRSITFNFLSRHSAGTPEIVEFTFEDPDEVEAFEVNLAGEIASGLYWPMGRIRALPLISNGIPRAIHGALAPHFARPTDS